MNNILLDSIMADCIKRGLNFTQAVNIVKNHCINGEFGYYKQRLDDWQAFYNQSNIQAMYR